MQTHSKPITILPNIIFMSCSLNICTFMNITFLIQTIMSANVPFLKILFPMFGRNCYQNHKIFTPALDMDCLREDKYLHISRCSIQAHFQRQME